METNRIDLRYDDGEEIVMEDFIHEVMRLRAEVDMLKSMVLGDPQEK